jgi:hypothetical protein
MFVPHKSVLLVMLAAAVFGCGTGGGKEAGGNSPSPEQAVRDLFAAEWNADADSSWAMLHPLWRQSGVDGDFIRYANDLEKRKEAWKDNPRSITRIKTFPGTYIPGNAQAYADKLGRERYEFAVVRAEVLYPPVNGYVGGTNDYLITLAREKKKGARWKIINNMMNGIVTDLFSW